MPEPTPIHISPTADPEIIWAAEEIKKLKEKKFFGSITFHAEHGIVRRMTTEESKLVPTHLTGPQVDRAKGK